MKNAEGPLFSVVIPTYNPGAKIIPTLESVVTQTPKSLREILIIDGASTDGTLERLRSYRDCANIISERDHGIYDAMNKGINVARGRFLYFLGAGDRLRPNVLAEVAAVLDPFITSPDKLVLAYGNVCWGTAGKIYAGRFHRSKLLHSNICHQAAFYSRELFERLGQFSNDYPVCADYEFNLRCFGSSAVKKVYFDRVVADYEAVGVSSSSAGYDRRFFADFSRLIRKYFGIRYWAYLNFVRRPRALLRAVLRRLINSVTSIFRGTGGRF